MLVDNGKIWDMKTSNIFPMPHHEESPEKTQYGNPSFLDKPNPILPYPLLFCQKFSDPPTPPPISQFPSILKKKSTTSLPPPLFLPFTRGGRDLNYANTMSMSSTKLTKFLKLQAKLNY